MKKSIMFRRFKIKELYAAGYQIIDIARYFEVPTTYIRKSLETMDGYSFGVMRKVEKIKEIEELLKERDEELKNKNETEVLESGFWRVPRAYAESKQEADKNSVLQKELRSIGIGTKEIRQYLNLAKDVQLLASRPQDDSIFDEQKRLAEKLIKDGWVYREIMEFCGISVGNLVHRDKESAPRKKDLKKETEKNQRMQEIFEAYVSDPSMTHQKLAKKFGCSRCTVITMIKKYKESHPDVKCEKRISKGRNGKQVGDTVLEALATRYMEKNKDGVYCFKSGYTIEKVAHELEINEITVIKYKKKLNAT